MPPTPAINAVFFAIEPVYPPGSDPCG